MKNNIKNVLLPSLALLSTGLAQTASAQYSPRPNFEGVIGKTTTDTKEWWPENVKAPKDAPNVIWILLDDVGFGATSTFGGLIETPNITNLANQGLRYTNFHTTSISTPSRASLLTGRNAHSVHFGYHVHGSSYGTPGYDGYLPFETGNAAEILRENGYNTFAIGKYHLTHPEEATPAGPFNRWPTGRGFDHYFGFTPATYATDSWHPILFEDTHKVEEDKDGRHVSTLLANKAIKYITDQKSVAPDKPFFLYWAFGASHEPHQVAKEWIDKYKGKFDQGWDRYRETVLQNQIKEGILPKGTVLPAQNPGIRPWSTLSADEKKLSARYMELYAGMTSHADYEIGRVVDHLKEIGQLDNTLIFVLIGDNGASAEGDQIGRFLPATPDVANDSLVQYYLKNIDLLGTEFSKANYPNGWATATNTPFKLWKYYPNSEGGTRNPLIAFWPKGIKDKGSIRNQYTYISDILPTTLELTGTKVPEVINGYKQDSLQGQSFAYSIAPENKTAPSRHNTQYFEISGSRAIYKDGWKAGVNHVKGENFDTEKWTLYHVNEDINELKDLADKKPEKLNELKALFDVQAVKYNVYPLKDTWVSVHKNFFSGKSHVVLYPGFSTLDDLVAPDFRSFTHYSIEAEATIREKTEGVLFSNGGYSTGFSLYVKDGKAWFSYNADGKLTDLASSTRLVPAEKVKIKVEVDYNVETKKRLVTLYLNNEKSAEIDLGNIRNAGGRSFEGIEVGKDIGTAVTGNYKVPFAFTDKIDKVVIDWK